MDIGSVPNDCLNRRRAVSTVLAVPAKQLPSVLHFIWVR